MCLLSFVRFLPLAGLSLLVPLSSSAIDITFDAQSFSPISAVDTTDSGAVGWDGLGAAPAGGFGTASLYTSASVTSSGITAEISGITGSWSGNSSSAVLADPLRADYFIIGIGATATLEVTGLEELQTYDVTFTHGNAEPTQNRGLNIDGFGGGTGVQDINNATLGIPEVTYSILSDSDGFIVVDLIGVGIQEGNLAGIRVVGPHAIPEPSWSAAFLGLGALLVLLRRRLA